MSKRRRLFNNWNTWSIYLFAQLMLPKKRNIGHKTIDISWFLQFLNEQEVLLLSDTQHTIENVEYDRNKKKRLYLFQNLCLKSKTNLYALKFSMAKRSRSNLFGRDKAATHMSLEIVRVPSHSVLSLLCIH
jgi:hypothetical protein